VEGLKHNLLSISLLCDKVFQIVYNQECCTITYPISKNIKFVGNCIGNTYMLNVNHEDFDDIKKIKPWIMNVIIKRGENVDHALF